MKKTWSVTNKLSVLLLCAALLTACSDKTATTSTSTSVTETKATAVSVQSGETASSGQLASIDLTQEIEYEADDAYTDWAAANPAAIKLSGASASVEGAGATAKDGTVTITAAGTYAVSGKLDDGQIVIDVPDKGVVRLVLNGAEIHNSSGSAIYVKEAGKTIISLPEGTNNVISDGETYATAAKAATDASNASDASVDGSAEEETDEPNAAIYSKDDLTINGTGQLVVEGNYNNGITSKDKLKVTGGTIVIDAIDDGLMGRDLVAIQAGEFTIKAGGHGIQATNDKAGSEGIINLAGGTFAIESGEDALHSSGGVRVTDGDVQINAGDDGIHAELALSIEGGTITIARSNEGIEAPAIMISEGKTSIVANDDGVNVAGGADGSANEGEPGGDPSESGAASARQLTISGGYLTVDSKGDGLDANGSIVMTGGTVIVNGPTENNNGALDYDGTFTMTGGFLIAAGSSGMVQATSDGSAQPGVLMTYPQAQQAGTLVHLADNEGNAAITFAPSKDYQAVFISSPNLKQNASYTLYSGGASTGTEIDGLYEGGEYQGGTQIVAFETASLVTWLNESGVTEARSGMGGMSGPGGGRGQGGDRMPPGGDGERPQRAQ
ncbi:carbohydrate-binding domain-containing protein [Paenibacillus sp. MMS18-CY102]|uniref:carbohydrate-binding domain-containing protein n=1 Tax=Paenibacillus sp. MMS18-CY102 TaxID=2682849 RepID=UPI0013653FE7|nr:carbohydrate-binding domain-containing protein [Paenibacillus sp. MMS18-CY102]MWC30263.1 carbohydrate-binding domain-containing protein [Paenibacillus sp. MMS18-CY102]